MERLDSVQHSFRLNLNNPKHLLVHKTLMDLNTDIHKSRAYFIIECIYKAIQGIEPSELTNYGKEELESRQGIVTRQELDVVKEEIYNQLLKDLTSMIIGSVTGRDVNMRD